MSNSIIVSNATVSELRLKKQRAIDVLDFDLAAELEVQISLEIEKKNQRQIADVVFETKQAINIFVERVGLKQMQLAEDARQTLAKIYSKYQVMVEAIEADHVSEVMQIEQERTYMLIQGSEKEIEIQKELIEEAKRVAALNQFEKAKELRQRAKDEGENELERRRKEIENVFKVKREETIKVQKQRLQEIAKQHEIDIKEDSEYHDKRFVDLISRSISEVKLIAQRGEARCHAIGGAEETMNEGIRAINEYAISKIRSLESQKRVLPEFSTSEKMRLVSTDPTKSTVDPGRIDPRVLTRALNMSSLGCSSTSRSELSLSGLLTKRPRTAGKL